MKVKAVIFLSIFIMAQETKCGVNLKNGNFYISYTDHKFFHVNSVLDGITRTYNSKSTYHGIFGYGWGSPLETYLKVYPDGSIVIKENGAGASTFFTPILPNQELRELMNDQIIDASIKGGVIINHPEHIAKLRNEIKQPETRLKKWDDLVEKGFVDSNYDIPQGSEWVSFEQGRQMLTKSLQGYKRVSSDDKVEIFDLRGKLTYLEDREGNINHIKYNLGKISRIVFGNESEVEFEVNEYGLITSIRSEWGLSTYSYKKKNNGQVLEESIDIGSNKYKYSYDGNFNMTRIEYEDSSEMLMAYYPETMFVKHIIEDGDTTTYEYKYFNKEDGTIDKNHYGTYVIKRTYNGELSKNFYEYQVKVNKNGTSYSYMIATEINGIIEKTFYDELCGLPTKIIRHNDTTKFRYNDRCLLLSKKSTRGDTTEITYHPKLEKISSVYNSEGRFAFEYDDRKNLTYALKNDSIWVELKYNDNGKITEMIQNEGKFKFEYDDQIGKPVKIALENVGEILLKYDQYGEIESVDSEQGQKMAYQVTEAFQTLLSIVKPAGVDFDF